MTIAGAVIALIRDHGPVGVPTALATIKNVAVGGDVAKASPAVDAIEGARLILNLVLADFPQIQFDGDRYRLAEFTEGVGAVTGVTIVVPPGDVRAAAQARSNRIFQLRAWVKRRPFANDWRDGIRTRTHDEVDWMIDQLNNVGYIGPQIVKDQDGVIIDGNLRAAALIRLGQNPDDFSSTRPFLSDMERLGYVIAAHASPGGRADVPVALRDAISSYIGKGNGMARGVDFDWSEIPLVLSNEVTIAIQAVEASPTPSVLAGASQPPPVQIGTESHGCLVQLSMGDRTAKEIGEAVGKDRSTMNSRLGEAEKLLRVEKTHTPTGSLLKRDSSQVYSITPLGRAALATTVDFCVKSRKGEGTRPGRNIAKVGAPRNYLEAMVSSPTPIAKPDTIANPGFPFRASLWMHDTIRDIDYLFVPDQIDKFWESSTLRELSGLEVESLKAAEALGEVALLACYIVLTGL
jgi:hypothetical protein